LAQQSRGTKNSVAVLAEVFALKSAVCVSMSTLQRLTTDPWAPAGFFFHRRANGEQRAEEPRRSGVLEEGVASPLGSTVSLFPSGQK